MACLKGLIPMAKPLRAAVFGEAAKRTPLFKKLTPATTHNDFFHVKPFYNGIISVHSLFGAWGALIFGSEELQMVKLFGPQWSEKLIVSTCFSISKGIRGSGFRV